MAKLYQLPLLLNLIFVAMLVLSVARPDIPVAANAQQVNPLHGIHAPVGFRWTDEDRTTLASFHNANGVAVAPGMVVTLSADMTAANNKANVLMERDLYDYQQHGSQILVRMWPQRFPGGPTEKPDTSVGTVSGTPDDAAADILRFLSEQQSREGWHFTNIVPGNEMNLEWPNQHYGTNLLPWLSNDDPAKFKAINDFMLGLYSAWQKLITTPEGRIFSDVKLYFPAIAQDGAAPYFSAFYYYNGDKPSANKYDSLQTAIQTYGYFSWHNYWRPGHAWEDRAIASFPGWLKAGLASNAIQGVITESGWSPKSLEVEVSDPLLNYWRNLPFQLWKITGRQRDPFTLSQDDVVDGVRFEDDLQYFLNNCSGAAFDKPKAAVGVAVWLAGSNGGFPEAAGLWRNQPASRWLTDYAAWNR